MIKHYKPRKGLLIHLVLAILLAFLLIRWHFSDKVFPDILGSTSFLLFPCAYLLYHLLNTKYWIQGQSFFYRAGFMKGEVDVDSIKSIDVGITRWVGERAALANRGLLIKYNRYDDVFIAPADDEELISDLLALNPAIQVNHAARA
ncbi:MAG: PH domain-containing protein [Lunatimonas sp.]|uniref:PH domain-containing protein n=1 Tax=Lunatimonas sp. TaxID=2060141 RepID=UPI00263AE397|nr:PH domain-containing protein [Lunatimonas sp.]MCC5939295.1 PH domain-containing protein [Lunatimonas sp.]